MFLRKTAHTFPHIALNQIRFLPAAWQPEGNGDDEKKERVSLQWTKPALFL